MSNFTLIWEKFLKERRMPQYYTGIEKIEYEEFKNLRFKFDQKKAEDLINKILSGKLLLVKSAFNKDFVKFIKSKILEFWKNNPNTFFEMKEGCPDYHRIITPEIAKNYSVGAVRHTTYFFPWNSDPCGFNNQIYERWRLSKFVAGLKEDEYEKNTPKDGSVDRIQIVCYPPKYGGVETHTDTSSNCNLAISCYLSSRKNKDFKTGGFYCLDKNKVKIDIENFIDEGDISLFCPTIEHGVDSIDYNSENNNYDWNSGVGRWWMGLFTNDSNEKKHRKTSSSLEKFHSEKI